jgi:hypothetical protein
MPMQLPPSHDAACRMPNGFDPYQQAESIAHDVSLVHCGIGLLDPRRGTQLITHDPVSGDSSGERETNMVR